MSLTPMIVLGAALALVSWMPPPSTVDFSGRVFDAVSGQGIENLEVKFTPPSASKLPLRIATTKRNGEFVFRQLVRSGYLLEISQGPHRLYRAEVDATQHDRIDIPLKRR
jgi:hypothetical protein